VGRETASPADLEPRNHTRERTSFLASTGERDVPLCGQVYMPVRDSARARGIRQFLPRPLARRMPFIAFQRGPCAWCAHGCDSMASPGLACIGVTSRCGPAVQRAVHRLAFSA